MGKQQTSKNREVKTMITNKLNTSTNVGAHVGLDEHQDFKTTYTG